MPYGAPHRYQVVRTLPRWKITSVLAESLRLSPRVLPNGLPLGFSMTPVQSDLPAADSASNALVLT